MKNVNVANMNLMIPLCRFDQFLVFALAVVPHGERNGQRRQSHYGKRQPVHNVRREFLSVVFESDDSALSRFTAQ